MIQYAKNVFEIENLSELMSEPALEHHIHKIEAQIKVLEFVCPERAADEVTLEYDDDDEVWQDCYLAAQYAKAWMDGDDNEPPSKERYALAGLDRSGAGAWRPVLLGNGTRDARASD